MYLVQESQLKTHHIRGFFFHLPPIADLAVAINRLLFVGFILLTLGLLAGFEVRVEWSKVIWGVGVWLIYGWILQAEKWSRVTPRRVAQLSVAAFLPDPGHLVGAEFPRARESPVKPDGPSLPGTQPSHCRRRRPRALRLRHA